MRGNNVRRFIENEESGFLLFFFQTSRTEQTNFTNFL